MSALFNLARVNKAHFYMNWLQLDSETSEKEVQMCLTVAPKDLWRPAGVQHG